MQAEEAIKLIVGKHFVLDCPQMSLTPQLSSTLQKGYSGPGFINQNDE
jgi:hypothetical protein